MKNFNLNIDDYTDTELFELFTLKKDCSIDDIEISKSKLASQLLQNDDYNPNMKQDIMLFIDTAGEKLKKL